MASRIGVGRGRDSFSDPGRGIQFRHVEKGQFRDRDERRASSSSSDSSVDPSDSASGVKQTTTTVRIRRTSQAPPETQLRGGSRLSEVRPSNSRPDSAYREERSRERIQILDVNKRKSREQIPYPTDRVDRRRQSQEYSERRIYRDERSDSADSVYSSEESYHNRRYIREYQPPERVRYREVYPVSPPATRQHVRRPSSHNGYDSGSALMHVPSREQYYPQQQQYAYPNQYPTSPPEMYPQEYFTKPMQQQAPRLIGYLPPAQGYSPQELKNVYNYNYYPNGAQQSQQAPMPPPPPPPPPQQQQMMPYAAPLAPITYINQPAPVQAPQTPNGQVVEDPAVRRLREELNNIKQEQRFQKEMVDREAKVRIEAEVKAMETFRAQQEAEKRRKDEISAAERAIREKIERENAEKMTRAKELNEKAAFDAKTKLDDIEKKRKALEEEMKKLKIDPDSEKAPVRITDKVMGRKFDFPWTISKNWSTTKKLLLQAYANWPNLQKRIDEGKFELKGPQGQIILPEAWDSTVQPAWDVCVEMAFNDFMIGKPMTGMPSGMPLGMPPGMPPGLTGMPSGMTMKQYEEIMKKDKHEHHHHKEKDKKKLLVSSTKKKSDKDKDKDKQSSSKKKYVLMDSTQQPVYYVDINGQPINYQTQPSMQQLQQLQQPPPQLQQQQQQQQQQPQIIETTIIEPPPIIIEQKLQPPPIIERQPQPMPNVVMPNITQMPPYPMTYQEQAINPMAYQGQAMYPMTYQNQGMPAGMSLPPGLELLGEEQLKKVAHKSKTKKVSGATSAGLASWVLGGGAPWKK